MELSDKKTNSLSQELLNVAELFRSPDMETRNRAVIDLSNIAFRLIKSEGDCELLASLLESNNNHNNISKQLQAEIDRTNSYLEAANAGTWEWVVQSGQEIFDERCAKMVGYTKEEFEEIGKDAWDKITHPEDLEKSRAKIQACIDGETDYYVCELRTKGKEGGWVWLEDKGRAFIRDENGKAQIMRGTSIDITERKKTENELAESERQFRALFENASDGIVFISQNGEILQVNYSFAKMHGYTLKDVQNMDLHNLDVDENSPALLNERMKQALKGDDVKFEVEHYHKDGHIITLEVTQCIVKSGDETHLVSFHRDITKRKQLENEIFELTMHDELTGLCNRRYLKQELEKLVKSGRELPISFISFDVNDLKIINDTYGHFAGDRVIKVVTDCLKDSIRPYDTAVRMGGDEFLVVLPKTDETTAEIIAARIDSKLSDNTSRHPVKVSIGISTAVEKSEDLEKYISHADKKMYEHKKFTKSNGQE